MANRASKRNTIIAVYLLLFFLFVTVVYFLFKPDPTCFDGKKNQAEEQVDCGGPCKPCPEIVKLESLDVLSVDKVAGGLESVDVVAKVKNPNELYGAASFKFRVVGSSESDWQEAYILPGETKQVVVYGLGASGGGNLKIEIDEENIVWKKFIDYRQPNLIINNSRYETQESGEAGFSTAIGTLLNQSDTDFEDITVKVFLRDGSGNLLAVNQQTMNTVRAGERRDYVINFSRKFPGSVEMIEVEPETNIFDSENYIRVHGNPEKWDSY